jgi:hypothetical protein
LPQSGCGAGERIRQIRLESPWKLDSELRAATRREVCNEPNPDAAKRSKLFVRQKAAWSVPEKQLKAYQWLGTKHQAILKQGHLSGGGRLSCEGVGRADHGVTGGCPSLELIDLALGLSRSALGVMGFPFGVLELVLALLQTALGFFLTPENAPAGWVAGGFTTAGQNAGGDCDAPQDRTDEIGFHVRIGGL